MSTLKVDGIRSNSATSDAITLASDGTCTANITNNLSNRNLIINGAMQVAQRGTSSTNNGYGTVDRFEVSYTGTNESPTQEQGDVSSGTTPYTLGFRKALKITNGNQTGGAGTADRIEVRTKLEAQDIADSGWNYTSASSSVTISFWVKSSVAQNFYGRFLTSDGTAQRFKYETGSLTADTWTKVTKTIPGNSNLQFDNNANLGLMISWYLFAGTDLTDSSALDTWAASATGNRASDMTSTWYTTNDATFEITGVQLEVDHTGSGVATDFEHRSYADELQRCYRYCQRFDPSGNSFRHICLGTIDNDDNTLATVFHFLTPFRAAPSSLTTTGDASDYAIRRDTTKTCTSVPSMFSPSAFTVGISFVSNNHGWSTGQSGNAQFRSNNAYLIFSAEL